MALEGPHDVTEHAQSWALVRPPGRRLVFGLAQCACDRSGVEELRQLRRFPQLQTLQPLRFRLRQGQVRRAARPAYEERKTWEEKQPAAAARRQNAPA
eukprot:12276361-Alexandrium_andersonii.AAC.1